MKAWLCVDEAVGETRRCLVDEKGQPFRIEIERWSERGQRVKLHEKRWVRAAAKLPGDQGWFVETGAGPRGILHSRPKDTITEGQLVAAFVAAEAFSDKGPRFRFDPDPDPGPPPDKPGLRIPLSDDPFLERVEILGQGAAAKTRETIDAAIEETQQVVTSIPNGGDISIEPTRALTAIDVDVGGHPVKDGSFEKFNRAAARHIARQIALRAIGGLVVTDFVHMHLREDRRRVVDSFRAFLREWGVEYTKVDEITQQGLCEAVITRTLRPVADAIHAPDGEREALDALRAIETAAIAAPGKRIRARLGQGAQAWLASRVIDWEAALADRIGRRWIIEPRVELRGGRPEVWAES